MWREYNISKTSENVTYVRNTPIGHKFVCSGFLDTYVFMFSFLRALNINEISTLPCTRVNAILGENHEFLKSLTITEEIVHDLKLYGTVNKDIQ